MKVKNKNKKLEKKDESEPQKMSDHSLIDDIFKKAKQKKIVKQDVIDPVEVKQKKA